MNETFPEETVHLVDDDPSVLRAVGRLVRSAGWRVAAFPSAREYLREQTPEARGCLVLDVTMPGRDGLELQSVLAGMGNRLPVIFLTGNGDVPMSVRAMKAGAVDFLCKPCRDEDLLGAIRVALARDREAWRETERQRKLAARFSLLTPREHQVMLGVVAGQLNKQIAVELGIAEKTIKVHRGRMMHKLGVFSVADLVRVAERVGLPGKRDDDGTKVP